MKRKKLISLIIAWQPFLIAGGIFLWDWKVEGKLPSPGKLDKASMAFLAFSVIRTFLIFIHNPEKAVDKLREKKRNGEIKIMEVCLIRDAFKVYKDQKEKCLSWSWDDICSWVFTKTSGDSKWLKVFKEYDRQYQTPVQLANYLYYSLKEMIIGGGKNET